MRAPKNEATSTTGQDEVRGAFSRIGWGPVDNPYHDLGTDLWISVRDERRFDLGLMVGGQVKSGASWFAEPAYDKNEQLVGWWFREDQAHFDYWLGHNIPHLVILHHLDTNAGYVPPAFLTPGHLMFAPSFPYVVIDPRYFRDDFAQDLNPKLTNEMAASQRPTSLAILGSPSGPGAWHHLSSWYAVSGADRVIDPDLQRFMAHRAGSTIVQFDDASHAGGFTHYATRFVKLIEQAVHTTSS